MVAVPVGARVAVGDVDEVDGAAEGRLEAVGGAAEDVGVLAEARGSEARAAPPVLALAGARGVWPPVVLLGVLRLALDEAELREALELGLVALLFPLPLAERDAALLDALLALLFPKAPRRRRPGKGTLRELIERSPRAIELSCSGPRSAMEAPADGGASKRAHGDDGGASSRKKAKADDDDGEAGEAVAVATPKMEVRVTAAKSESANGKNMTSFSVYPADYVEPVVDETAERPGPAKSYAFELDGFQAKAVACIDKDESVLVSAHTSAGKTVCAEYAIAKSLRDGQRVIYTSPIKALSNQKFRDLQEEFGDVGLMTGDITINPSAKCLVMTTEILRSMLYRGSEVMREVKWVVYDEIHYMRDKERGVVWEESIILLPHSVRFVFLSATIPNSVQFASWIAQTHRQPCHVVYTDYRPTPLVHYVFAAGGEGLHLVVDEQGAFKEANFERAMAQLGTSEDASAPKGGAGGGEGRRKKRTNKTQDANDLQRIITLVIERDMAPAIIFAFSKAQCEQNAVALKSADFNTDEERDVVEQVYARAGKG